MIRRLTILAAATLIVACSGEPDDAPQPQLRTEVVCEGGAGPFDVYVEQRIADGIGPSANDLALSDERLWIVESGANRLRTYDLAADELDSDEIYVGSDRNPYALAVDEEVGEAWVANFVAGTLSVIDLESREVVHEIEDDAFSTPSAIALSDDYAYVGDVEFRGASQGYGPGSVIVVERQSRQVVEQWETAFQNPHFLSVEQIDGEEVLFVSESGALDTSGDRARVLSEGGLEWFDIAEDPVSPPSQAFSIGQGDDEFSGGPGRPLLTDDGDTLYFASAVAPEVYGFDVGQREWIYDVEEPLTLYESDGDTLHRAALGPDGMLWVTAFNDDALWLVDTNCDAVAAGPIDLGEVANMLEGPQSIVVHERGAVSEGFYLLDIANALGRVRLEPTGDEL